MARRRTEEFSNRLTRAADMAKALSHPARIRILQILKKRSVCICGEIVDEIPLSQATVSQHLKELKRVGLIKGEVEGPRSCYCLDEKALERMHEHLTRLLGDICG
jgi:DNA-binding transcriptional ArsR family regulator